MGGTKLYSPPADPKVSFAWDNWSCGVVLYAMFCGALPFSLEELGKRVVTLEIPPEIPDGFFVFLFFVFCFLFSLFYFFVFF